MKGLNKVGIGRTAEVYRDDDGSAVKLYYDWMPESEAEREAATLQKISLLCRRAPQFIGMCHMEGRKGLRCEFIDGKMAGVQMMQYPLQIFRLSRAIGSLQREIHSVQADGLRPVEDVFGAGLKAYQGIDDDIRNKLLDFIREQRGTSLCHGDFHPENILIENNGQMRVVDWVNCYSGNPLSDVARTYYLIRHGRSPIKRTIFEKILESVGKSMIANAYLRAYFDKGKVPKKDFRRWMLIIMINRLVKERIAEEEPFLRKTIPKLIKSLPRA